MTVLLRLLRWPSDLCLGSLLPSAADTDCVHRLLGRAKIEGDIAHA